VTATASRQFTFALSPAIIAFKTVAGFLSYLLLGLCGSDSRIAFGRRLRFGLLMLIFSSPFLIALLTCPTIDFVLYAALFAFLIR
jgi:hypothetical protein